MNDVLGQIVFAKRDVDLLTEKAIGPISLRLGSGTNHREVAACLWLGQVHRAGPSTADQVRHPALLQLGGPRRHECFDGPIRQQRAKRKRQVGRIQHFGTRGCHQLWQPHPTKNLRMLYALPTCGPEGLKRFNKSGGRCHHPIVAMGWIEVTSPVQRGHDFLMEPRGLLEHRIHGVSAGILKARQGLD